MREEIVVLTVTSILVFAGLGVLWMAMTSRRAVREMEHRERLAMIQRGLMPAPETDPLGFESAVEAFQGDSLRSERWRTAGTLMVGLGIALMVLLTFGAGAFGIGFGVGGAFTVLGGAVLLNGVQLGRGTRPARYVARRPGGHPDPPSSSVP